MESIEKRFRGLLEEEKDVRSMADIALGTFTTFVMVVVTLNVFGGAGIELLSMIECKDLLGMLGSWLILVVVGSVLFGGYAWKCIGRHDISAKYIRARILDLEEELIDLLAVAPRPPVPDRGSCLSCLPQLQPSWHHLCQRLSWHRLRENSQSNLHQPLLNSGSTEIREHPHLPADPPAGHNVDQVEVLLHPLPPADSPAVDGQPLPADLPAVQVEPPVADQPALGDQPLLADRPALGDQIEVSAQQIFLCDMMRDVSDGLNHFGHKLKKCLIFQAFLMFAYSAITLYGVNQTCHIV